jgi:phage gp46-like protein
MSDFKTVFTDLESGARYSISDGAIVQDQSIVTNVIVSLFTDKRDPNALPEDARGFWGDDEIGSLRWTIKREKQTDDILNRFIQYDTEALDWLRVAGLVSAINITALWVARGVLQENITLTLSDGSRSRFQLEES